MMLYIIEYDALSYLNMMFYIIEFVALSYLNMMNNLLEYDALSYLNTMLYLFAAVLEKINYERIALIVGGVVGIVFVFGVIVAIVLKKR